VLARVDAAGLACRRRAQKKEPYPGSLFLVVIVLQLRRRGRRTALRRSGSHPRVSVLRRSFIWRRGWCIRCPAGLVRRCSWRIGVRARRVRLRIRRHFRLGRALRWSAGISAWSGARSPRRLGVCSGHVILLTRSARRSWRCTLRARRGAAGASSSSCSRACARTCARLGNCPAAAQQQCSG
jgi:hypothetical protein